MLQQQHQHEFGAALGTTLGMTAATTTLGMNQTNLACVVLQRRHQV